MSRLLLSALTAVPLALAGVANAGPAVCGKHSRIADHLKTSYAEKPVSGGLQSANALIEVWTSRTGATWTILVTRPDGISCVVATGTNWVQTPAKDAPDGTAG